MVTQELLYGVMLLPAGVLAPVTHHNGLSEPGVACDCKVYLQYVKAILAE